MTAHSTTAQTPHDLMGVHDDAHEHSALEWGASSMATRNGTLGSGMVRWLFPLSCTQYGSPSGKEKKLFLSYSKVQIQWCRIWEAFLNAQKHSRALARQVDFLFSSLEAVIPSWLQLKTTPSSSPCHKNLQSKSQRAKGKRCFRERGGYVVIMVNYLFGDNSYQDQRRVITYKLWSYVWALMMDASEAALEPARWTFT